MDQPQIDESKQCVQHENKPITHLNIERGADNIFMCRDCCIGKDQTKLVSIHEILNQEGGKAIKNWPIFTDEDIVREFKKKLFNVMESIPKRFQDLQKLVQEKLKQSEEHIQHQIEEIKNNFSFTYSSIASKKKLSDQIQRGNKKEIQKIIEEKYVKKASNTEDIQEYLNQVKSIGKMEPLEKLKTEIEAQFKILIETDLNKCQYPSSIETQDQKKTVEEQIPDFVSRMKQEFNVLFPFAHQQGFMWEDHTSILGTLKIEEKIKILRQTFQTQRIIFVNDPSNKTFWQLPDSERKEFIMQKKNQKKKGSSSSLSNDDTWWCEIEMTELDSKNKDESLDNKEKSFVTIKGDKQLQTLGDLRNTIRSNDKTKFDRAQLMYTQILEMRKQLQK